MGKKKDNDEPRVWVIRGGKNGEREQECLAGKRSILYWENVGDLSRFDDYYAIREHVRVAWADRGYSNHKSSNYAGQMIRFAKWMQPGDLACMPRKGTDVVAVGEVVGEYQQDPDNGDKHIREINWINESVPRSNIPTHVRNSMYSQKTVFEIRAEGAYQAIKAACSQDPSLVAAKSEETPSEAQDATADASSSLDYEEHANDDIIEIVKKQFPGHEMAELVGEILRAQGYVTKVSPPGKDQGVDILAANERLGKETDHICVQVKATQGSAGSDVVQKLLGAINHTQAKSGLLVSTGGVTKDAQALIDSNFFKVRLWDMTGLLEKLYENYHDLSEETRARLTLKRIWVPVENQAGQ